MHRIFDILVTFCSTPWGVGDQLHEMINSLKNNLYFPTNMNIKKYLLKLTTLLLVENIDHRPVNYCLWAKSILLPVFIHKVLFEHSQPVCFHIARDCSHAITTEFYNTAETLYNPQRLKYLLPGPLQERLADPWHGKSKSLPETMHASSPIASSYQKPDCANIFLSGLRVQKVGLAASTSWTRIAAWLWRTYLFFRTFFSFTALKSSSSRLPISFCWMVFHVYNLWQKVRFK